MLKKDYLKLFPTDWVFWTMLGISSLHQSNVQAAKDSFQHALQTTNQIEPFLYLSQCHIMEGDIKSAIFVLRRATEFVFRFAILIDTKQISNRVGLGICGIGCSLRMFTEHLEAIHSLL